jgi:hypothetical protein
MPMQFEKELDQKEAKNLELLTQNILMPKQNYCDISSLMKKFQTLEELSNEVLSLKDMTGKLSVASLIPVLAGLIYAINAPHYSYDLNFFFGIISFLLGMFPGGVIIISLISAAGRDLWQFGWVNKLLCKIPRFKNRKKNFTQYRDNLYINLISDEFKHDYLTHVQFKIMQYQQLLRLLNNEDEQYHFDDIECLKESIINLKRQQSVVVKTMIENEVVQMIKEIHMTESMFFDIDSMVKEKASLLNQKSFIEKHKAVLEKKGLSQMIDATNAHWQNTLPPEQKLENYL